MTRLSAKACAGLAAGLLAGVALPAAAQSAPGAAAQADANYRALAAEEASKAGDPAYDYALGIAAADSGRFGAAIIAFQRVLAVQPNHAQARAELARAYAMAGDIDTARQQFATVVDDPSLPDPVRQRFTGFVRQFDRQIRGGGSDLSGFAEAGVGHDSNINAATDLAAITIPLFAALGPGTLGAGARATDDEFYELSSGLSGVVGVGRQDRVYGSLLGNWRDNFGSRTFDQASLTGTAGYAHTFANQDVVSLSGQVQKFWLGHASYRNAYGAIGQYTHRLDGGRALSFSAQWNRLDYDADPLRSADRFTLGAGLVTRNLSASLIGGHEETRQQAGDHNSHSFAGASIGAEFPIMEKLAVVGGAALQYSKYDQADALFLVKREDTRLDLSAGLKFAVMPKVFIQPKATYTRNWSNIALYDHERWTASASLRFEF
ncbi:MAG: tetratricopeptide repeat protein [Novosphingobium sp.]